MDRVSDSQTYETSCQLVAIFITLSYRKQMYLFVSQQSVDLKETVMVTEKTRHSSVVDPINATTRNEL